MKRQGRSLFVLCYLAYASIYVARLNLTAASPCLRSAGVMTESQLGGVSSLFLIVYACGRLFNGAMCDRFQPRHAIFAGMLTIGLSNLLLGLLPPFPVFCLLWGINGYAQSMLWGPVLRTVCAKTPPERKTAAVSILGSAICVGNVAGLAVSFFLIDRMVVCWAFFLPGCLSLAVTAADAVIFRCGIPQGEETGGRAPRIGSICQPEVRRMLVPAVLHGVLKDNLNVWVALFFAAAYGIDTASLPLFIFLVPITGMVGRLVSPALYRMAGGSSDMVNICAFLVCAVAVLPLAVGGAHPVAAAALLCLLSASVQVINNSILAVFPSSFQKSGNVSQVAGWMDFFTYLGAGISANIYGYVVERVGFGAMFASWGVLSLVGAVWLCFWRQRECSAVRCGEDT